MQNLQTGEEWPVYEDLSHDQQETWAIFGVYPNFAWTPDCKNLVFYAKGKIRKIDLNTLQVNEIPFQVNSSQTVQRHYISATRFFRRFFGKNDQTTNHFARWQISHF